MTWLFLCTIVVCLPQGVYTQTTHAMPAFVQIINHSISNPTQNEVSIKKAKERRFLKKRLLLKWFEKKMKRTKDSKKAGNTIGWLSLVFGILAIIAALIVVITDLEALLGLLALGLIAGILALILGIISLIKRSLLKDKQDTKAWPAITGIVLTALLAILIAILLV